MIKIIIIAIYWIIVVLSEKLNKFMHIILTLWVIYLEARIDKRVEYELRIIIIILMLINILIHFLIFLD